MKLSEIDFRAWNYSKGCYEEYPALAKLCSVVPCKSHHIEAKPFVEYDESGDELEIELWTGRRDIDSVKIFEGDILKFKAEIETELMGVVVFINGFFACRYYKNGGIFPLWQNKYSEVIGNIHENPELLGDKK